MAVVFLVMHDCMTCWKDDVHTLEERAMKNKAFFAFRFFVLFFLESII